MGKQTWKERIPAFASILGLLTLIVAYYIVGAIRDANVAYGLKAIVNQSVVVALVATGAVFIYTLGSFDISLGAATGVSALLGAMAYNATGSLVLMFLVCVGVAVALGFINSSLASIFNLPIFVTTVAMMSVLSAFMLILIGWNGAGDTIKVKAGTCARWIIFPSRCSFWWPISPCAGSCSPCCPRGGKPNSSAATRYAPDSAASMKKSWASSPR
jgi:ribose transport system permease protein